MFSPYVEVAGIFRITENMALSPFVGIEYETRFKGPRGGFYVNFGIGILYSVGDWFTRR